MKKSILTSLLLFMICSLGLSQVEFSGTVTDENSEPVIGATVRVQDSSIGAITDVNGNYLISGVNAGDVIIASFVGMEDAQHTVAAGETSHNFVLTQGSTALEDVVIIGYGEVEKDDLTGSVTSVSSEEFNIFPKLLALIISFFQFNNSSVKNFLCLAHIYFSFEFGVYFFLVVVFFTIF